jgi:DNA-binding CsgD family transcriptional regulator
MDFLPFTISLIAFRGRPMSLASSVCVMPRASNSSARNSPGGMATSAQASVLVTTVVLHIEEANKVLFDPLDDEPESRHSASTCSNVVPGICRQASTKARDVAHHSDEGLPFVSVWLNDDGFPGPLAFAAQCATIFAHDLPRPDMISGNEPIHRVLSDRELQVMRLIAAGKTAVQIARELSLSVNTVGTYRSRILHKMGMNRKAQIIGYAARNGLTG